MSRTVTQARVLRLPEPDAGGVMAAYAPPLLTGGGGMLAAARLVLEVAARRRTQGMVRRLGAA